MNNNSIQKYLRGETSDVENDLLMQWIEAHPDNRRLFMQYRRLYDATLWNAHEAGDATSSPGVDYGTVQQETGSQHSDTHPYAHRNDTASSPGSIQFFKKWMRVAAIVALAVAGTLLIQQITHREQLVAHSVEVPAGQRVNLTLSDGTRVTLNSNSKLHFPSSFDGNNREVTIDGEGFFEVAHDASRPFIVKAGDHSIRVLGTRFNVMAYQSTGLFETSLLEGSVQVENNHSKQQVVLSPNERVTLKANQLVRTTFDGNDDFLWRDGIYVFKNESLTDLFLKLEQYYQVTIRVKNKQLLTQHCTGKFRQKEGIEHIIKVLQKTYNFNYTRNEITNTLLIY